MQDTWRSSMGCGDASCQGRCWLNSLSWGGYSSRRQAEVALARFAGTLGLRLKKQTLDAHFTQQTADWLLALLQQAVRYVVCAQAVSLPLLRRFRAVLVEDGSQITLPAALQERWPGCGGTATDHADAKTKAGMKLTVRWDVLGGAMDGPYVQAGRAHESRSPLRERQMAPGSLWIADLGYFALQWLGQLSRQGVFFLLRHLNGTPIWSSGGKPIELLNVLPQTAGAELDLPIVLGARKLVQARLLAIRLPADAIKRRQERMQERARKIRQADLRTRVGTGAVDDHGHQRAGEQAVGAGSVSLVASEMAD